MVLDPLLRTLHSACCFDTRKSPLDQRVRRLDQLEDACVSLQHERPDANGKTPLIPASVAVFIPTSRTAVVLVSRMGAGPGPPDYWPLPCTHDR
jgi:hypothetical protein